MTPSRPQLQAYQGWQPPENWQQIHCVDAHTGGEPLRVIFAGFPQLQGDTILARRRDAKSQYEHLRKALMWEPRGHADMYGCLLIPAVSDQADFGVLFMHNEGYSSMCGHGILAITKVVLQLGLFPKTEPLTTMRIDTPAGLITAHARVSQGKVASVYFHNVPSYVVALDQQLEVPGYGKISYDLAFGGAYYAYVDVAQVGLHCNTDHLRGLIEAGTAIKRAVMASRKIEHPFEPDLGFLYGTIFIGPAQSPQNHSRNVCIFADREVDRSPTGTGVSGRLAIHHARGQLEVGEAITIESIIGSPFTASVAEVTSFADHAAIIPQVEGNAYITAQSTMLIDPEDPQRHGFMLR